MEAYGSGFSSNSSPFIQMHAVKKREQKVLTETHMCSDMRKTQIHTRGAYGHAYRIVCVCVCVLQ